MDCRLAVALLAVSVVASPVRGQGRSSCNGPRPDTVFVARFAESAPELPPRDTVPLPVRGFTCLGDAGLSVAGPTGSAFLHNYELYQATDYFHPPALPKSTAQYFLRTPRGFSPLVVLDDGKPANRQRMRLLSLEQYRTDSATFINARAMRIRAQHWSKVDTDLVLARSVREGMTADMVKLAWGEPKKITRSRTAAGVREQWIFDAFDSDLYLTNGKVTAMKRVR